MLCNIETVSDLKVFTPKIKSLGFAEKMNLKNQIEGSSTVLESIVIDLRNVELVDSTILGLILTMAKLRRGNGSELYLINASNSISKVLRLTRLDYLVTILKNRDSLKKINS